MGTSDHGLQVCQEKIALMNPLLQLTLPYASEKNHQQLLAIHAWYACLDQLVMQATDDHVFQTQLEWWRMETTPEKLKQSRHPVLRFLNETGAAPKLSPQSIVAVLDSVALRLGSEAPVDIGGFRQICDSIYRPRVDLEVELNFGNGFSRLQQDRIGRQGGFLLLLQDSFKTHPVDGDSLWWMPLSLLARSGFNRVELADNIGSDSAKSMFEELFSTLTADLQPENGVTESTASEPHLHLVLLGHLQERQLLRFQKGRPENRKSEFKRTYFQDVIFLWRAARKIRSEALVARPNQNQRK